MPVMNETAMTPEQLYDYFMDHGHSRSEACMEVDRQLAINAIVHRNMRQGDPSRPIADDEIEQQLQNM